MTELGEKRRATIGGKEEMYKLCPECGQEYWSRTDKNYPTCRACGIKVGKTYTNYKGYTFVKLDKDNPYYSMTIWLSLMGDSWVRTARLAMAQHLGRCLEEDEEVWHRDGNKNNDAPDNLVIRKPKPEKVLERMNKKIYDKGYQEGYKVGYEEGYSACFEEGKEFRGDTLTTNIKQVAIPIKIQMPKPPRKPTNEETATNQEFWAEEAKKRQRRN